MTMTPAQQQAYEAALARSKADDEVPTQRLRSLLQGLTFGSADEAEAWLSSLLTGKDYQKSLDEVRGKIKAYQGAHGGASLAYEAAGAALPAIGTALLTAATGGAAAPTAAASGARFFPLLAKLAALGAAEGSTYAFATGEDGFAERVARVPGGATLGAIGSVGGYGLTRAMGGVANRLMDGARRTFGGRGSTVVENEIQRLVQQTGRSADEIAQDIIDGRLLAENKTIRAAVRALRSQGGEASTIIQEGLEGRPAATRAAAMQQLKGGLGAGDNMSEAMTRATSEEATRAAERAAYAPFKGVPASDDVVSALKDTLKRVPSAAKELEIQLQAEGAGPFFKIDDAGEIVFTRTPTVSEAESVRRAVSNRASALFRAESMGGAGEAVSRVEKTLKSVLDFDVAELGDVRAQAAAVRANRDAYEMGRKALVGDVNEKLAEFARISQGDGAAEAVAAFRAGLMQALEAKATTGARQSLIRNLADPAVQTKEAMLLREVFPQDDLPSVLQSLDVASEAQEAASKILHGSPTAETQFERIRQGAGISAADAAGALQGDAGSLLNVAKKIVGGLSRTDLSDAERARIARVLVSDNPELVRAAIQDESALARLAGAVSHIIEVSTRAAQTSGAVSLAGPGADISGGLLSPRGYVQ